MGIDNIPGRPDPLLETMWFGKRVRLAFHRPWVVFAILALIGFGLRLGYGIARYQSDLISLSGHEFVAKWDHDGLEHVLIASALLSGKGYLVDDLPGLEGKTIRGVGKDAVFKAPVYQFFLAGIFALSGFSFLLFFPVQALLGGLLSGIIGLITLETFDRTEAAWIAGLATAAHPVLVNSASQPYNENLFLFLFAATLWAFTRWLETQRISHAIVCGILVVFWILTREAGLSLFLAMLAFGAVTARRKPGTLLGLGVMLVVAAIGIAPWSVRNYLRLGFFVPVASIVGGTMLGGNNECAARESFFTAYREETPCPELEPKMRELFARFGLSDPVNPAWRDRVAWIIVLRFILDHPVDYLKLCLRRMWTVLLPYNPAGNQRLIQRAAFAVHWLAIFPVGLIGLAMNLRKPRAGPALLALLISVTLLNMGAVAVTYDLRHRVGFDLLLGAFAAWGYCQLFSRLTRRVDSYESSTSPVPVPNS